MHAHIFMVRTEGIKWSIEGKKRSLQAWHSSTYQGSYTRSIDPPLIIQLQLYQGESSLPPECCSPSLPLEMYASGCNRR